MSFLKKFTNVVEDIWNHHGTSILTGAGVTGIFALPFLSGIATYDAIQSVEEEKKRQGVDELELKDILRVSYKHYILTALDTAVSAGLVIKANSKNLKRNNDLLNAYLLSEGRGFIYRHKTEEKVGPTEERKIYQETVQQQGNDILQFSYPALGSGEDYPAVDLLTGQLIEHTNENIINAAKNELNAACMVDQKLDCVSYSDFLIKCGGNRCDIPFGWRSDGPMIDPLIEVTKVNKRPCLLIAHRFGHEPYIGYDEDR